MGLFQRALETYESHVRYTENKEGVSEMALVGHIPIKADIVITLDSDGKFVSAESVGKNESEIIIPVTENSAGRSGTNLIAHPLCDQLKYFIKENEAKYKGYVDQLTAWVNSEYSHPKLRPILNYVLGDTIIADLYRCNLVKSDKDEKIKEDKRKVCWRIQEDGDSPEECWRDRSLIDAFTRYYLSQTGQKNGLCMVTGETTRLCDKHPKGIFPNHGNAKLISTNDGSNFTYRGRFIQAWQAVEVGYEASIKAHNALRWLIQEQGANNSSGRAIICWNPQGKTVTQPTLPFRPSETVWQPSDYRKSLKDALESRKRNFKIGDNVVVAAFDAASDGRLAVTYYNEFGAYDFLQRLHDWDETCCWTHYLFGIQSPSLKQIIDCAFGTQITKNNATRITADDKIMCQQLQRLMACRIERTAIGVDIVKALANRASQPQAYDKSVWEKILFTACAVIRKYRYDRYKEEWDMALEPNKNDRSYQFGRLLAVMEKVERDTYVKDEKREPNAIRMMSVFSRRPMYAARIINENLEQAYFPRLEPLRRKWYKSLISEIMEMISQNSSEERDKPLEDSYLMGYYLQRSSLYQKKANDNDNTEENKNEYTEE